MYFIVVNHDPVIRHILSVMMEKQYNAEVLCSDDDDQVVEAATRRPPDILITSTGRRNASGEELIRRLRGAAKTSAVPIVVLCARMSRATEIELIRDGVDAVLRLPFHPEELRAWTDRILKYKGSPDIALIESGCETKHLDLKMSLDLESNTGRAAIAKDVIAMANVGGGHIVVGVAEVERGFVQVGLDSSQLKHLETTRFNDKIRRYVGPRLSVSTRIVEHAGMSFGVIEVPGARASIALAFAEDEQARLFMGRVYARTEAAQSCEVREPTVLEALLERAIQERHTNLARIFISDSENKTP